MKKLDIPITPQNYAVWYEYSGGQNRELNKSIDQLLNEGRAFTEKINEDLYQNYIGTNSAAKMLSNIQSETERLLFQLLNDLELFQSGTKQFSDTLKDSSERLETTISKEDLMGLVGLLMTELEEVKKSNSQMEDALKSTTDQVVGLRLEMAKLHGAAMVDSLTGILNRRAFDEAITDLTFRWTEDEPGFCLLMLDIDHFKKFNDEHGHLAGDKVLVYVATLLKNGVKGEDIVARFGGEEFAILLPETSCENAISVAWSLCKKVSSKILTAGDNKQLGKITISIGVASFTASDNEQTLVDRADKALYTAKQRGRNQVRDESELDTNCAGQQYQPTIN